MRLGKYVLMVALISGVAKADDTSLVHFSAHFGMSYAIDTFSYGLLRGLSQSAGKGQDQSLRIQEMAFAVAFTLLIGFAYKALEAAPAGETAHSMIENGLGVGAATLSFVAFRW